MPPSNAMENDKKRLRNQFTKDERTRLLAIMTEYGPLLDDKNISIVSRKEIWEIVENKFNENGHSGRTSAQLKKYWQNYKYHSKRTKIVHKEVPKPLNPMTKHMVRMLAKVNPEEWTQYDVAVNAVPTKKSPASSEPSHTLDPQLCPSSGIRKRDQQLSLMSKISTTPPQRSSKSVVGASSASDSKPRPEKSGVFCSAGGNGKILESNVVVSTTDVPGSSVTVSIICPEVPSKGRTIFWKGNTLAEKVCPKSESIYSSAELSEQVDEVRNSTDEFSPDVGNSNVCDDLKGDPINDSQSGKFVGNNSYGNLINIVGTLAANKSQLSPIDRLDNFNKKSGRYHDIPTVDDHLVQTLSNGQTIVDDTEAVACRDNRSSVIENVVGVVENSPRGLARLSKDCDSMETSESISMTNGRDETTKTLTGEGPPNPSTSSQIATRENRRAAKAIGAEKRDVVDYSEFDQILQRFSTARDSFKRTEILNGLKEMGEVLNKFGDDCNFEEDCIAGWDENRGVDMTRFLTNRREDSSPQGFSWLKLYLRLLRGAGQPGGSQNFEILRKIEPLISMIGLTNKGRGDNEESSDSERGMEVDECTNADNLVPGNLRVRRVSLMTLAADEDQVQREIKVETEVESETSGMGQDTANDDAEDERVTNSMNYLVQAKLQSVKSELDHQLKLQKLEMEEKELRVKIAEMAIQETRLRIQALVEDRQRATEIHELRLAQMAAEKARSEAEHAAQVDATFIATAEGRARINSIESDRERSENFYQMQLRCMTAGAGANGNCATVNSGKCKQYQQ